MKSTRALLGAMTLAAALLFAAGCGSAGATSSAGGDGPDGATAPAGPAIVLTASITKSHGTSGKFTVHTEAGRTTADVIGIVNSQTRRVSATETITSAGKVAHEQIRLLGTDIYVQMDLPIPGADPNKWIHLDTTRLKSLTALGLGDPSDPTNVAAYGKELATVQETSPGHFQGTLDITKAPLPSITAALLAQAGDALKSVPFEATTDSQDRLVSMTINLPTLGPNVPASITTVTFSAFGTPVNIQPPSPSETQEAPAIVYQGLGG